MFPEKTAVRFCSCLDIDFRYSFPPPFSSLYLHVCLSLLCSWNGLYQEVWTEGQSIMCVCVHVCMCLCVNKIKWEWMCGPPRGLAARAVYNLQATSLLLFCPLPSSFLPLPVFFYCVFLWLQMREEKHVDIIQYQAVKLKSRGQQYGHRILCRDELDGWMDREDQQLECVHTKHVWTDSHCKSVAFFRALKYY